MADLDATVDIIGADEHLADDPLPELPGDPVNESEDVGGVQAEVSGDRDHGAEVLSEDEHWVPQVVALRLQRGDVEHHESHLLVSGEAADLRRHHLESVGDVVFRQPL